MKLTHNQLIILQDTLRERIKYMETYEEVYDHVLTALEQVDANIPLGQAINTIMLNDFGGFKGLKKIEEKRCWMVARQMVGKQAWYLIDHLKFPLLPITLIIYALVYYGIAELKFQLGHMFIYMPSMLMMPLCSVYFKNGFRPKSVRKSIKWSSIPIICFAPIYIYYTSFFLLELIYHVVLKEPSILRWFSLPPTISSLLFTLYVLYLISFFRLYKSEFNPQITSK